MPLYAPGTQANFDAGSRRDQHAFRRNQNIADILGGLGQIAQTLGQVRRQREAEANDALYAQHLAKLMGGGGADMQTPAPEPITRDNVTATEDDMGGFRGYQPPTPAPTATSAPSGFEQGVMRDAAPRPSDRLATLGRTIGIGTYQPRLSGQQAASLVGLSRQGRMDQAATEHQRRMEGFEERRVGAAETSAQADLVRAGGTAKDTARADLIKGRDDFEKHSALADKQEAALEWLKNSPVASMDDAMLQNAIDDGLANGNDSMAKMALAIKNSGLDAESRKRARESQIAIGTKQLEGTKKMRETHRPAFDAYQRGFVDPAVQRFGGSASGAADDYDAVSALAEKMFPGVTNPTAEQIDAVKKAFASGRR